MEHVPRPLQPLVDTLKAPLLTKSEYDDTIGSAFVDYPVREGWTPRPADQWRKIFKSKDPTFLAFLQRWLYFGLFQCVLGRRIRLSWLSEPGKYLSSQKLHQLADEYMALSPGQEPDHTEILAAHRHALHMHLGLFAHPNLPEAADTQVTMDMNLETFIETVPCDDPRDPETVIATSLMLDFVQNLLPRKWDGSANTLVDDPKMQEMRMGPMSKTLMRNGWCISEAAAIIERFSASGVYFMTQIRPPNPISHQQGAQCLHYKCSLRQLNDATYRTKHASSCAGNCQALGADADILASILVDENTIPLLSASNAQCYDKRNASKIVLEPWDGSKPFVAISHVWADGLGNPNANALPQCQLQRLSDLVQSLTGRSDIPFWIDTICVPPDAATKNVDPVISKKQRQAQDQAMVKMRQTYEESSHVLVLDAWILSETTKAMSDAEKLMRIFCSGWNTRLWTYQEGALAKRLWFQLRDEIYDMDKAILRIRDSQDWALNYTLRAPLMVQYDSLRGFRSLDPDNAQTVKHLAKALAFRTTSVASDETLCLSALMAFNVQDILDVKVPDPNVSEKLAEARMTKFWSLFDRVPAAIINFDGPTLPADGYGWAPSSLLLTKDRPFQAHLSFLTLTGEPAFRTNKGLDIRLPGLEFRSNVPLGLEFYVEDEECQFYHFSFELLRFKDRAHKYTHNHRGLLREEICLNPQAATGSNTLAFLFDPVSDAQAQGILVAVDRNQAGDHLEVVKLGHAALTTLHAPQHKDAQFVRDHISKSSQNTLDYQRHNLVYPPKTNQTLLCSKGRKVQSRTWRIV